MQEYCNRDSDTSYVSVPSVGSRELVERFRQKFIKEARMIASFCNAHIISIHDVFEENGTAYYVMEYLEGKSLASIVKEKGLLAESLAIQYINQIAEALAEVHANKLLHLDIKPANIMLNKKGEAVLIDFGISKHYDESGKQTSSALIGISEGYAPLEQYESGALDSFVPATDIYALGATFFFLLTGQRPPKASEVMNYGLPELPQEISPSVRDAVTAAMQPSVRLRPQSIEEFLLKLKSESGELKGENSCQRVGESLLSHATSAAEFGRSQKGKVKTESFDNTSSDKSCAVRASLAPHGSRPASVVKGESPDNEETRLNSKNDVGGVSQTEPVSVRHIDKPVAMEGNKIIKSRKKLWIILLLLLIAGGCVWFLLGDSGGNAISMENTGYEAPEVVDSFKTRTFTVNGVSFKMVAVEGGSFKMGATSEQQNPDSDEFPLHSVTLDDYYIGETEVTQELWQVVMGTSIQSQAKNGTFSTDLHGVGKDYPMYYISYEDCDTFIYKLNTMLASQLPTGRKFAFPTEAQWEYAARGGNKSMGYQYSGSDNLDNVDWYDKNSNKTAHPVKQKQANELGLYDMGGNVYEWCYDWYGDYTSSSQTNPEGPSSGSYRVLRGVCWCDWAQACRVANRNYDKPDNSSSYHGLRLAL